MSTTKMKVQTSLRPDAEIARNVKRSMKADFEVPDDRIAVKVVEGFVTIEGIVTRDAQKDAAEVRAKQVQGVRGIANKIIVEPAVSPTEA
jgi:osmotically-inducible protein OsmY